MLRTKIHKPNITPDLMIRSRLIDELNSNICKPVTLVSAPAGYGKSMAISQWINNSGLKSIWISLDEEMNDLRTFLEYFNEAMNMIAPGLFTDIQQMLKGPGVPKVKIIFEEFVNRLDKFDEQFVIVLDDYHFIKDQEIHDLINFYFQNPPENIHLIIISRIDPPLKISQSRIYNKIFELRTDQLAFSKEEISELALKTTHNPISEDKALQLLEKTEGWILGLKMIFLNFEEKDLIGVPKDNIGKYFGPFIGFIEDGSSEKYSEDFKNLLLHSSLLKQFNSDIIDHFISSANFKTKYTGKTFISDLLSKNMFIIAQDDRQEWYRFHHFFRELLLDQLLKKTGSLELKTYYLVICDWFENNNYIDMAITYAVNAKDYDKAAAIIENNRKKKLNEEQWWVVKKWMDQIPENIIAEKPVLLSTLLFIYIDSYRFTEFPPLLQLLENMLKMEDDKKLYGELYFHKGFMDLWVYCKPESALEYLKKAQLLLPGELVIARRLAFYIAVAKQMKGQEYEAIKNVRKIMSDNPGTIFSTLDSAIIIILLLSGKIKTAEIIGEYFCFSLKHSVNIQIEAWANYLYGNALFQKFEVLKAGNSFKKALDLNPFFQYRLSVDAMTGRILSCYFSGNEKKGKMLLEEFPDFANAFDLPGIAQSVEARIQLWLGNFNEAMHWAQINNDEFHIRELQFVVELPLITKARIFISSDDPDKIKSSLEDLKYFNECALSVNNQYHMVDFLVLQALGLYKLNQTAEAEIILKQAFESGESWDIVRPFIESGMQLKKYFNDFLISNPQRPFIRKIIKLNDKLHIPVQPKFNVSKKKKEILIVYKLSSRELQIISEVSKGLRNQDIAGKLNISVETVKSHVKNSLKKLNVKNRVELIRKAASLNLID